MAREVWRAGALAVVATAVLLVLIVVGSRNLAHFDAALVGYTFATLFATFGFTYRYAMWLQRPPTAMYFKRGWQVALRPGNLARNLFRWIGRSVADIGANRFIFRRDPLRGLAHLAIMWGCIISAAITFPLVFGWIHFEQRTGEPDTYHAYLFGFRAFSFGIESLLGHILFHGLVWAAIIVIAGVMIAMRRRMRDDGAASVQEFGEDFLPLILLFSISVTGLMLLVGYQFMHGYAYEFMAILHAATVILTLIYLPFGKLFHLFQRPAQLGVAFYKDVGAQSEQAHCRRCGQAFASKMHIEDLITVERQLGFDYTIKNDAGHYQWICPPCRRKMYALAQEDLIRRDGQGLHLDHGES